jgi:uncharacterized protein (TIGR00106 family)
MPIMEISILPLGTESASVSKHIKGALDALKGKSDIQYQVTAMGTVVEAGSVNTLLNIAKKVHKSTLAGATRVVSTIKIDDRKDKKLSIQGKLQSVCGGNNQVERDVDEWLRSKAERMLKKIGIDKDQTVLDFGCRSGNYTAPAAKIVGEKGKVYGVDKEKNRLNELRERVGAEHLRNIVIIESSDWKSEIEQASVDRVILFDVLHPGYFPQKVSRKKLLNKIYEVLKPGGIVFILPTHTEERNLPLKDFITEVGMSKLHLESKFTETLVHDNKLQKCEILKFRKAV